MLIFSSCNINFKDKQLLYNKGQTKSLSCEIQFNKTPTPRCGTSSTSCDTPRVSPWRNSQVGVTPRGSLSWGPGKSRSTPGSTWGVRRPQSRKSRRSDPLAADRKATMPTVPSNQRQYGKVAEPAWFFYIFLRVIQRLATENRNHLYKNQRFWKALYILWSQANIRVLESIFSNVWPNELLIRLYVILLVHTTSTSFY